jgi:hypothetical protein
VSLLPYRRGSRTGWAVRARRLIGPRTLELTVMTYDHHGIPIDEYYIDEYYMGLVPEGDSAQATYQAQAIHQA